MRNAFAYEHANTLPASKAPIRPGPAVTPHVYCSRTSALSQQMLKQFWQMLCTVTCRFQEQPHHTLYAINLRA